MATIFFSTQLLIGFRGLRLYWHWRFSCETKNEVTADIWILSIFIKSFLFFSLYSGIYRFSGSVSLLALTVFLCESSRGYSGHLDFIIDFRLLA